MVRHHEGSGLIQQVWVPERTNGEVECLLISSLSSKGWHWCSRSYPSPAGICAAARIGDKLTSRMCTTAKSTCVD